MPVCDLISQRSVLIQPCNFRLIISENVGNACSFQQACQYVFRQKWFAAGIIALYRYLSELKWNRTLPFSCKGFRIIARVAYCSQFMPGTILEMRNFLQRRSNSFP